MLRESVNLIRHVSQAAPVKCETFCSGPLQILTSALAFRLLLAIHTILGGAPGTSRVTAEPGFDDLLSDARARFASKLWHYVPTYNISGNDLNGALS